MTQPVERTGEQTGAKEESRGVENGERRKKEWMKLEMCVREMWWRRQQISNECLCC